MAYTETRHPLESYVADYEKHLSHLPPEVAAACIQARALDSIGTILYYTLSADTAGKGVFEAIAMALAGDGLKCSVGEGLNSVAHALDEIAHQIPSFPDPK